MWAIQAEITFFVVTGSDRKICFQNRLLWNLTSMLSLHKHITTRQESEITLCSLALSSSGDDVCVKGIAHCGYSRAMLKRCWGALSITVRCDWPACYGLGTNGKLRTQQVRPPSEGRFAEKKE